MEIFPKSLRLAMVISILVGLATAGTSQQPTNNQTAEWPVKATQNAGMDDGFPAQDLESQPQTAAEPDLNLAGVLGGTSATTQTPSTRGPIDRVGAAGDMIGFSHSDASGTQTITLVHTGKSWMAVYHIDRSGKVRLVSSRPIDADFSLQLNATAPLPEEIRKIGRR